MSESTLKEPNKDLPNSGDYGLSDIKLEQDNSRPTNIVKQNITICVTATGPYIKFLADLITSCDKYFMPELYRRYIICTDQLEETAEIAIFKKLQDDIHFHKIIRKGFPGDSLYKFHHFLDAIKGLDILNETTAIYMIDADMRINKPIVASELLPHNKRTIVAVKHPYYPNQVGPVETRRESSAYIDDIKYQKTNVYFCGGFCGATRDSFIDMAITIAQQIDYDDSNELIAEWHDESHMNHYFFNNANIVKKLPMDYCFPEEKTEEQMTELWNTTNVKKPQKPKVRKILALKKEHQSLRSHTINGSTRITCDLKGGLGNQLFQVATTLAISFKQNKVPVFDLYVNKKFSRKKSYRASMLRNLIRSDKESFNGSYRYPEPQNSYKIIPTFPIDKDVYLAGYFQSWKYFEKYREEILKIIIPPRYYDFANKAYLRIVHKFREAKLDEKILEQTSNVNDTTDNANTTNTEQDKNNTELSSSNISSFKKPTLSDIKVNTVAIHVRRGDYKKLQDSHPLCSKSYYMTAMEMFEEEYGTSDILWFVFSDDLDYCRRRSMFNNKKHLVFIDTSSWPKYKVYDTDTCELLMMSMCNGHIISNSTFSAWGSWLSKKYKSNKTIAPKVWFGSKLLEHGHTAKDLYMPHWTLI